jgi:hypothetical protein
MRLPSGPITRKATVATVFRRQREREAQPRSDQETARLAWRVRRQGRDLIVTLVGPGAGSGVQLLETPEIPERPDASPALIVAAVESLLPARGPDDRVATIGFALPRKDEPPMTFAISIALSDLPPPEVKEAPSVSVGQVRMADGAPALRIVRVVGDDVGLDEPLPQLSYTFVTETPHGLLAVALSTPHISIDNPRSSGNKAWTARFDTIGRSCSVQPAPGSPASS